MRKQKLGLDVDGVFANFTDAYSALLTARTGIVFPKMSDSWPPEWYFDRVAGVTKEKENEVWDQDIKPTGFWLTLDPLPGTEKFFKVILTDLRQAGHDIYFITTRPGQFAKALTEEWIERLGFEYPTVIIAENEKAKGAVTKALGITSFLDDKPGNCLEVLAAADKDDMGYPKGIQVNLLDAAYNREFRHPSIVRMKSVEVYFQNLLGVLRVAA